MKANFALKCLFGMSVLLPLIPSLASAQDVTVTAAFDAHTPPDLGAKLVFSDAAHLYAIGNRRAIIYVTGALIIEQPAAADIGSMIEGNVVNLDPDTDILSVTSDGRTAILDVGAGEEHARFVLLDVITGQRKDIPSDWYEPGPYPNGALSGDGRLVSIYSESGPAESPMTVTVYDWPTKTLVATRTSEYISAGGGFGGSVTADGFVEFENNRVGRKVVDLKTGRLIGWFGPDTVRSPDGAWAVEFPNLSFNESAPKEVLIKDGASGEARGKLDVQVPDDEMYGQMSGAFCGTTGRFVAASGRDSAVYAIPSGKLLASFPAATWRDASADDTDPVSVACSPRGTRVAILSGTRLTFHDMK